MKMVILVIVVCVYAYVYYFFCLCIRLLPCIFVDCVSVSGSVGRCGNGWG